MMMECAGMSEMDIYNRTRDVWSKRARLRLVLPLLLVIPQLLPAGKSEVMAGIFSMGKFQTAVASG